MLLNNNLLKKLEQLQQEMQEVKGEDRKQKLEMLESELKSVGDRLSFIYGQFSGNLLALPLLSNWCFAWVFVINFFQWTQCKIGFWWSGDIVQLQGTDTDKWRNVTILHHWINIGQYMGLQ